jgi:hypothetical protein
MRVTRSILTSSLSLMVCLCLVPTTAVGHPMGNFSISHYAKLTVDGNSVTVLYLLDLAEIPTYQDIRQFGLSPKSDDPSVVAYLSRQAESLKSGITLDDNGDPLLLECISRQAIFAEGAGGLPTMKLGFIYLARLTAASGSATHKLTYTDGNYAGHSGWKEIVVAPGKAASIISTSAPSTGRSQELTNYPTDLLNSAPQALTAIVEVT